MTFSLPATSANLGPGFDCLGLALDFRSYFSVKPATITSIQVRGEGAKVPKMIVDNVFVRLFGETFYQLTRERPHFRFQFQNNIPISRGLGSSSAAIIGAITAAFFMAGKHPTPHEILSLALEHEPHPDNITPACVGGFTVATLKEPRKVTFLRKNLPDSIRAVVVIPNHPMSTSRSRRALPKQYSMENAVFNLSHSSLLAAAFFSEQWDILREASQDRLHQEFRMRQFPVLFEIQRVALEGGALMSTLSGSGSSFFNLVFKEDSAQLAQKLTQLFPKFKVLDLAFDNEGSLQHD